MRAIAALALLAASVPAQAELDLDRAGIARLDNGLTVIVLEDRTLPVVSVQMLYRTGSRDETAGKTGLAHLLEHFAFRASTNFPDGAATDAIYDAGGEWHGYTWIDQTTYYSTAPADRLDLLLAIEADRMANVTIDPASVEAEIGAVLTELRGYRNDPTSVLFDAVAATALQAHPYRNNTIGYESDVAALTAEDARAFYAGHYAPGNAVLAVVGDVDAAHGLERVRAHFARLPARAVAARVVAAEPPQSGERRVVVTGPVERQYLRLAFPAPAASSPDFPGFLLLQELLSGGSGVNFRQNDWGTPSIEGSVLAGAADDMASWVIPTADPYLFMLSASTGADDDGADLEAEVVRRIEHFRSDAPAAADLAAARRRVREQLVFDLETQEDAAHQLAFFEGLGALGHLLALEDGVDAATPEDIHRLARLYLAPERRTIGWYVPGARAAPLLSASGIARAAEERAAQDAPSSAAKPPQLAHLSNGLPVIIQPIDLSPTASVLLVTQGEGFASGYGSISAAGMAADLPGLVAQVAENRLALAPPSAQPRSNDPMTRLGQMLAERAATPATRAPIVAVVSGAVEPTQAIAALERSLGQVPVEVTPLAVPPAPNEEAGATLSETIALPLVQAAIGYALGAPAPASDEGFAMRMLLYVLTHEYGGRLGRSAISDTGLVYYIGSDYSGDANAGRIAITAGVDPGRIDAMETLMRAEIARLASDPPRAGELAAARSHILGREASAAMDNGEIAAHLARRYVETGSLPDRAALAERLEAIGPTEIAHAARAFAAGTILRVDVASPPDGEQP